MTGNVNVTNINSKPIDEGTVKAWVNFNGTGTPAVRDSFNVTSITDNALGDQSTNLTNSMATADYSAFLGGQSATLFATGASNANIEEAPRTVTGSGTRTASSLRSLTHEAERNASATAKDWLVVCATIIGDLA